MGRGSVPSQKYVETSSSLAGHAMRCCLRVMGSPDPYGKQIDGMGAATSSTSKTVILSQEHAIWS